MNKILALLIKSFLVLSTIGTIVGAYLLFYYSRELPDYSTLAKYHPPLTTRIYSIDGKLVEQYAKENRIFVHLSMIPKDVINAFIAAEDKNFYHHTGLDYVGILRAAIANVGNILRNKRLEGASTITQQVVKNFLLTNERSLARKIKEAILSFMVSKSLTKDQILELYLNQTFFGKNAYGIASAALTYFNKSVEDLSLDEAAFIAGLPKAPSKFDPVTNYARSKERRDYVIGRMLEDGYISVEQARESTQRPITLKKRAQEDRVRADYFAEAVRNIVIDMYGEEKFYTGGLTIITTMDSKLQKDAEYALQEGLKQFDQRIGYHKPIKNIKAKNWLEALHSVPEQVGQKNYQLAIVTSATDLGATIILKDGTIGSIPLSEMKWAKSGVKSVKSILNIGDVIAVEKAGKSYSLRSFTEINGGLVIEDASNGSIRAHVGGGDFAHNKYDRVLQAQRQPGSLAKAFVYLAALENGIEPNAVFNDLPIELNQGPGMPMWRPKNYKSDFLGPITFRTALEKSRNLVTVRVAKEIGISKVAEEIVRLGLNNNPPHYYSMVLGALETTLSKVTNAYGIIANGGYQIMPHYIEFIQDKDGKIIYRRDDAICRNCEGQHNDLPMIERTPKTRILNENSAFQLTHILKGAVQRGTSSRLNKYQVPLAAKTGTTNNSYDTWNVAYTPDLVFGTYVGFDNPRTMGKSATGATVALPVIDALLSKIVHKIEFRDFPVPDGIEFRTIDKNSGKLYNGTDAIAEAFKKENASHSAKDYTNENDIESNSMFEEDMTKDQQNEFLENVGEVY